MPAICGLGWTGEMSVPPNCEIAGVPYWACLPKVFVVTFLIVLPKFQMQAPAGNRPLPTFWPALLVSVQYG